MTPRPGSAFLLFCCLASRALCQDITLYPIVRQGKTGFIDRRGNMAIAPQFAPLQAINMPSSRLFSEGLQPIANGDLGKIDMGDKVKNATNGGWGYIDGRGIVRIPFQFAQAEPFSEGLAAVRVTNQQDGPFTAFWGFIDHSGSLKIPAGYTSVGPFSDGLAWVQRNNKVGYVDKTGFMAIDARFGPGSQSFSEGLAAVVNEDSKWGFIDRSGNWVIPPRYRIAASFHDGLAVADAAYIDHSGKMVAGPFTQAWEFSEGLGRVISNGRNAFIDVHDKIQSTLGAEVDWAEPFLEGMAVIRVKSGSAGAHKYGYIDRSGSVVIPPIYDSARPFQDGLAFVAACGQTGYISKDGTPVFGIQLGTTGVTARTAPPTTAITPEAIERITHHPGPLTIKEVAVSSACDDYGKKIWSVVADAADGTFRPLTISLLQGGSFLSEERIGNIQGVQKQISDNQRAYRDAIQKEMDDYARTHDKQTDDQFQTMRQMVEGLDKQLDKPAENPSFHPIDGKGLTGYVLTLGLGPGGSSSAASVFSPNRQYEILVAVDISNYGSRFHATEETKDYAQRIRSPLPVISEVALEIASLLFAAPQ
jgi:hypothetical protein